MAQRPYSIADARMRRRRGLLLLSMLAINSAVIAAIVASIIYVERAFQ